MNIPTSSITASPIRVVVSLVALLALIGCAEQGAQGQDNSSTDKKNILIAASEKQLWVAVIEDERCTLHSRGPNGIWRVEAPFKAPVVSLVATDRGVYAFSADGSFWHYLEAWRQGINFPGGGLPIHMIAVGETVYALVHSAVAAEMTLMDPTDEAATSQPFIPGDAPLSIVRYDSRGWKAVAACPSMVTADVPDQLKPRLCHAYGHLMLSWLIQQHPPQVGYTWLDLASGKWLAGGTVGVPGMTGYALPAVNRIPTLVASRENDEIEVLRLLGGIGQDVGDEWQRSDLTLSALPPEAGMVRPVDAVGFNQHLSMLVIDQQDEAYLRFGRFDGPATMTTDKLFEPEKVVVADTTFRMARALMLFGILAALLVFRRSSIVTPLTLPSGWEIALTLQRLAGCLVDLGIFTIVGAFLLQVNWSEALGEMGRWAWAVEPGPGGALLPEGRVLTWWCVSTAAYTFYNLILEILGRRTLGKTFTRVSLMTESGGRPRLWQILVRNLFRFIEVLPPFWILGFLVVLSRNRQRVGDIFGRTVAVRQRPEAPRADDSSKE
ncbi:MAG: RDD family protein [Planctomycetota bacterium]